MTDEELLDRAAKTDDFSRSIIVNDKSDDWAHVKEVGRYLVRVHSASLFGHLVLARACRHLGELGQAAKEARECRMMVRRGNLGTEVTLVPALEEEERHLSLAG
jgi:hypothetical protein